jgi:hypothetical protein
VLAAGVELGTVARTLFPGGVLVDAEDLQEALDATRAALACRPRRPIFEATFEHHGVVVRVDVLRPAHRGYRLVEVKSSASVKEYHLTDVAVQSWVARSAGVDLDRIEIAHVDTRFVYSGRDDYTGLLAHVNVTDEVRRQHRKVPRWIREARATLDGTEPEIAIGDHCTKPFACPFSDYCAANQGIEETAAFPVEVLPRAVRLTAELRAEGYDDLRQVPEERLTNPIHLRMRRATLSEQAEIEPAAGRAIAAYAYPRYYLDFETFSSAVPVWSGTRPYMQVPFQWSCHVETEPGQLRHAAFLAEGPNDSRRAFAESVLETLGKTGPVFVYNAPFEETRLNELCERFPDLSRRIRAVIKRIVDLLPLARANYYHPAMNGSWSLKAVLPTMAPDLDYADLAVADGGMAQEAFRESLDRRTSTSRQKELRKALLDYCERDTLALVRIARYFTESVSHAGQSET